LRYLDRLHGAPAQEATRWSLRRDYPLLTALASAAHFAAVAAHLAAVDAHLAAVAAHLAASAAHLAAPAAHLAALPIEARFTESLLTSILLPPSFYPGQWLCQLLLWGT
jgi:hypothetical protein